MGKSFKRRWNKRRLDRLKTLRGTHTTTDELITASTAAAETVKEIIHTLSEPEPTLETPTETVTTTTETTVEPVLTTESAAPKKRRRRKPKVTTPTE